MFLLHPRIYRRTQGITLSLHSSCYFMPGLPPSGPAPPPCCQRNPMPWHPPQISANPQPHAYMIKPQLFSSFQKTLDVWPGHNLHHQSHLLTPSTHGPSHHLSNMPDFQLPPSVKAVYYLCRKYTLPLLCIRLHVYRSKLNITFFCFNYRYNTYIQNLLSAYCCPAYALSIICGSSHLIFTATLCVKQMRGWDVERFACSSSHSWNPEASAQNHCKPHWRQVQGALPDDLGHECLHLCYHP